MPEESPGLRRLPVRTIKWLGHDILKQHPLARMLHESRALAAAQEKKVPLQERPSYRIRQQRIFARGRGAYGNDEMPGTAPEQRPAAPDALAEPGLPTEPPAGS